LLFLAAGILAHTRRPDNRVGLLMVTVGFGLALENLQLSTTSWVHSVGMLVARASSGFLAHLVLAFPEGRLHSLFERALVVTSYASVFLIVPIAVPFDDTSRHPVHTPNALLVTSRPDLDRLLNGIVEQIGAVVGVCIVVILVRRWRAGSPPKRRVLAPVLLAVLVGGVATAANGLVRPYPLRLELLWIYWISLCVLPVGFLAGVLRVHLGDGSVRTLVIQLSGALPPNRLRAALARALRDPSLQVGYWRADADAFVDQDGRVLPMPPPGSGRDVRLMERDGRPVAILVHDSALSEDGKGMDAIAAAAGLALDNQRLADEVRVQLEEVRASRNRIMAATDAERRRLERDLHDGAQQRLVAATLYLRQLEHRLGDTIDHAAAELLDRAAAGLDAAIAELRELARGIHPAVLTEAGLVAAADMLAARMPMPIELTATDLPRLTPAAELAGYYVISEALANTLKHARARRVEIDICYEDGLLRVRVSDDGVGGAAIVPVASSPSVHSAPDTDAAPVRLPPGTRSEADAFLHHGTGLLGLRDRVAALDGTLAVDSSPGLGTTVAATLPAIPIRQGGRQ